jgi:hypothetical protein
MVLVVERPGRLVLVAISEIAALSTVSAEKQSCIALRDASQPSELAPTLQQIPRQRNGDSSHADSWKKSVQ